MNNFKIIVLSSSEEKLKECKIYEVFGCRPRAYLQGKEKSFTQSCAFSSIPGGYQVENHWRFVKSPGGFPVCCRSLHVIEDFIIQIASNLSLDHVIFEDSCFLLAWRI